MEVESWRWRGCAVEVEKVQMQVHHKHWEKYFVEFPQDGETGADRGTAMRERKNTDVNL